MVVTDAGSGRPDPASRRERALTRRIERLRADLANGEFEKATLRRERDAAQQRAEAAERRLHEVRAETSARTAELELVAAVAESGRKSAEISASSEKEKARFAERNAQRWETMLMDLARHVHPVQPPPEADVRPASAGGYGQFIDFDRLANTARQPVLVSMPPSFPVTRPGYSRPQVNRFVSWALSGRFKLRPTARFELKDAGYSPADVHSYVESVAAGLNPAVKEKVLAELTLARQQ
jgi:hypothetical protein